MIDLYREATNNEVTNWTDGVMELHVMPVVIDYKAGCEAKDKDSMGWQTCSDDGDLESFTVGVNAALGIGRETT
jgi:hypothetical protein